MIIQKKRIRNPERYLNGLKNGEEFYIGITDLESHKANIIKAGFTDQMIQGEMILPNQLGPLSTFNSEGKYVKLTDLPFETAYYQKWWTWKDWGGHSHSKVVDVPYERYPRDFVPPPSEHLFIALSSNGKLIVSKKLVNDKKSYAEIKHCINLFLELFGCCTIVKSDFSSVQLPKRINLNWKVLPPGNYPWADVMQDLSDSIRKQPKGNRKVIIDRLDTINKYDPVFYATGQGGFDGYVVFGFPEKGIYILESVYNNNATYVFGNDWESLSRLTKREILIGKTHDDRLIHREGWHKKMKNLLAH